MFSDPHLKGLKRSVWNLSLGVEKEKFGEDLRFDFWLWQRLERVSSDAVIMASWRASEKNAEHSHI